MSGIMISYWRIIKTTRKTSWGNKIVFPILSFIKMHFHSVNQCIWGFTRDIPACPESPSKINYFPIVVEQS